MKWSEQFDNKFCAEVMGKVQPHLWGHDRGGPEEVKSFISAQLEKLIDEIPDDPQIYHDDVRIIKQQLRDKWLNQ